jgi:2-amino-4-hydroxy-6-hydroxymethyldihydropteridine diphosphokinase
MRAGIALGSNLGDRMSHLIEAWQAVRRLPHVSPPFLCSGIYETEPVGTGPEAGAFLNAVAEVEYDGRPSSLLDGLQQIEARLGRPSKRPRNAPRPIDLDILYVGNLALANQEIVIPHPRLHLRRFVLQPLHEIRPELILPGQQRNVAALLAALDDSARVDLCPGLSLT